MPFDARNVSGPAGRVSLVQDYREEKEEGRIRLPPALPTPPAACGADASQEEQR